MRESLLRCVEDGASDDELCLQACRGLGNLSFGWGVDAIKEAQACGCTAIFVTVDAPVEGNREKTYHDAAWLLAIGEQIGSFPAVRTLEGAILRMHGTLMLLRF